MLEWFSRCSRYLEYVPLVIIGLLLVAEHELEKRALHLSFQIVITSVIYIVFFLLVLRYGHSKILAVVVCGLLWVSLVHLKNCLIPSLSAPYMLGLSR